MAECLTGFVISTDTIFLMSVFQIWKATKTILIMPGDLKIHRIALLSWKRHNCPGKKQVISALKMISKKVIGVSSPHYNQSHMRVSWQAILTPLTHANAASVEQLAKSMGLPCVYFPGGGSASIRSPRVDLKGLQPAASEGKTSLL